MQIKDIKKARDSPGLSFLRYLSDYRRPPLPAGIGLAAGRCAGIEDLL
jgi:hypothetical protein